MDGGKNTVVIGAGDKLCAYLILSVFGLFGFRIVGHWGKEFKFD